MKPEKTIDKACRTVQARIDSLDYKIDHIKEKYPEDVYGTTWVMKADEYKEERNELQRWIKAVNNVSILQRQLRECQVYMGSLINIMSDSSKLLDMYGESSAASRLISVMERRPI